MPRGRLEFSPYSLPENPTRQDPIPADGIQLGRSCPKQSPECGCISSPARAVGYCSRPQRIGNGPFRMAGDEAASSTDETFATTATGIFPRGPSGGSSCLKFAVLIGLGIVPRSLASHVENMLERPGTRTWETDAILFSAFECKHRTVADDAFHFTLQPSTRSLRSSRSAANR